MAGQSSGYTPLCNKVRLFELLTLSYEETTEKEPLRVMSADTLLWATKSRGESAKFSNGAARTLRGGSSTDASHEEHDTREVRERADELKQANIRTYLRWPHQNLLDDPQVIKNANQLIRDEPGSLRTIRARADLFHPGISKRIHETRTDELYIAGRIIAIRRSGKSLFFLDVVRGHDTVQIKVNLNNLIETTPEQFRRCARLLRRGDHISARGFRSGSRDSAGSSLAATELPVLEAPCLQRFPVQQPLSERDTKKEFTAGRHVELLTYPDFVKVLQIRAKVIQAIRMHLDLNNFLEVQTPILSASAGGASARPFLTAATEFSDRKLALRIAPELWLKRLIVGGVDQIYEIGSSFRNEGLDRTHNPEFTTCEFYAAYLNIERLMSFTERMFVRISSSLRHANFGEFADEAILRSISLPPSESFKKIDFIPAINDVLGSPLPDLRSSTVIEDILAIFEKHAIAVPQPPTLPRLLDKLSSHFLEPQCKDPTWIINIPECLSPLSKSFIHPTAPNNQPVAARAELYIGCKEVVNCYEEENSPFEQRRKFEDQQRYARTSSSEKVDDEAMQVDEDYIRALEWGLPPTGGWGCGVDRLVMLIAKQERIGDVLSCGNLRTVTRGADKWSGEATS